MKKNILFIFLILAAQSFACNQKTSVANTVTNTVASNTAVSNKSAETVNPSAENARLQAKSCLESNYQGESAKYADCLQSEIIKSQGGREKVLAGLTETHKLIGKISYTSLDVSAPSEIKTTDKAMIAVIPFKITRKNFSDKNEISSDFLIGVSEDQGKTWKFATSSLFSPLEKAFPGVKDLKTPEVKLG